MDESILKKGQEMLIDYYFCNVHERFAKCRPENRTPTRVDLMKRLAAQNRAAQTAHDRLTEEEKRVLRRNIVFWKPSGIYGESSFPIKDPDEVVRSAVESFCAYVFGVK